MKLEKENLPDQWKLKDGREKIVNVKSLVGNVFDNLSNNIAQTTPDLEIKKNVRFMT